MKTILAISLILSLHSDTTYLTKPDSINVKGKLVACKCFHITWVTTDDSLKYYKVRGWKVLPKN